MTRRFSLECRKVIGFLLKTLRNWLKKLAPRFHEIKSKTKTNRDPIARVRFPAFCVSYMYIRCVLIGSLDCLCPLWLAWVITLVWSFLWHSIENRPNFMTKCWQVHLAFFQLQLDRLLRSVFWRTWLYMCHEGYSRHAKLQQWVNTAPEGW